MAPTLRSHNEQTGGDPDLMAAVRAERAENERLAREDPAALAAKIHANLPWNHCAMCRLHFKGYGNSAQPLLDGVVCDECDVAALRPHRMCVLE